ncbi:CaiB/BaiF CoA transferase family protein [Thalassotalea euphylliae]|uniref:CoA transferase n=1 Tax=Thalassotalea euphylliae TaxID=1655234 RepID=A0A3E0U4G9_9GAMM|nr:CaiB/BaiF CoA-transferase family protein [Thalassotalea euphylliae]REL31891.1 CoA transferase [Thalassotalea euphylliae]
MAGPLAGIKVLDLSRILAGPWSTQVLADYGAEVWKIERPITGDDTRSWGPPFITDENTQNPKDSAYYLTANRGKKSFTIDFTTETGQRQVRELAMQADVIVENYKVGGLAKYQLDYTSIKSINPKMIYCSITGFGQDGPYAQQAGYDAMIQAMGGLMSITGEQADLPGAGPQRVGVAVADLMTGMYAVSAILAALYHREQTGEGQQLDIALLDTMVAMLANQGSNYLVSGEAPKPMGTAHPNIVPYQAFTVKDGHIFLAVGNDQQFKKCCDVLGCPELTTDTRFAENAQRVNNRNELITLIGEQLQTRCLDEWLADFNRVQVPCSPINTLDRVFSNPQVQHRQMQFELPHASAGKVPMVANPVKFSATPNDYQQAPPLLGEHNDELESLINRKCRQ